MGSKECFYSLIALLGISGAACIGERTTFEEEPSPTPIVRGVEREPPQLILPTSTPTQEARSSPAGGPTLQLTPEVTQEILSPSFSALKEVLTQEIQEFSGDAAIVITDLQDGEAISINGNVRHLTGCTINILPFLSVLEDLQNQKYELDSNLTYNMRQGIPLSQPQFVVPLLEKSGGSMAGGIEKANELRDRLGAKDSLMDHEPLYGAAYSIAGSNNYFTANDANLVLTKLWQGEILDEEWTRFAIEELTNTNYTVDFVIPAGIPDSSKIAHKIGYHWDPTGWVYNDIGFVIAEKDGKQSVFAIAYFSQYGPYEGSGSAFGAKLAQISWQHFAQKYNLP